MYKHLTPKKDQLFRRQVKQAFKQRQTPQTSKQTSKQTKCKQKNPILPMAIAKANTETSAVIKPYKEGNCSLCRDCTRCTENKQSGNPLVKMCVCNF